MLGTLYVNPYAILERRNDPAISSNADALDIGPFAHICRCLLDLAPLGGLVRSVILPLVATYAVNILLTSVLEAAFKAARPASHRKH